MKIAEKNELVRAYFEHENLLKDKLRISKLHDDKKIRDNIESDKRLQNRKMMQMIHEEEGVLNKIARQKEVDQHQLFLKLNSSLNII